MKTSYSWVPLLHTAAGSAVQQAVDAGWELWEVRDELHRQGWDDNTIRAYNLPALFPGIFMAAPPRAIAPASSSAAVARGVPWLWLALAAAVVVAVVVVRRMRK